MLCSSAAMDSGSMDIKSAPPREAKNVIQTSANAGREILGVKILA